MKSIFKKIYDGLLSMFSTALEELQNVHHWFRKQERKAKEYKKDFKKYMDTGEIDTIKYGTSEKSKFQRKWYSYNMHKHFSAARNINSKKKLNDYKEFIKKYLNKLGFTCASRYGRDMYKYNEIHWTPIPYGYEIKHLMSNGTFSRYIPVKNRKDIWNKIKQGKFGYRNLYECFIDGLKGFFVIDNIDNFEVANELDYKPYLEYQKMIFHINGFERQEEKQRNKNGLKRSA